MERRIPPTCEGCGAWIEDAEETSRGIKFEGPFRLGEPRGTRRAYFHVQCWRLRQGQWREVARGRLIDIRDSDG